MEAAGFYYKEKCRMPNDSLEAGTHLVAGFNTVLNL